MANLISIRGPRPAPRRIFFNREELNRLLTMYSRRVMSGEWRDYAIDHDGRRAVFSVFRHTAERPAFSITKAVGAKGRVDFILAAGPHRLKQARTVDEVIAVLDRQLRLVWSAS
jgi:hypothetical protein